MWLKKIWKGLLPFLKNKYTLTLIVFLGWILFFDQSNLVERVQNMHQIHQIGKRQNVLY